MDKTDDMSLYFRRPVKQNLDAWYEHMRPDIIIGRVLGMVIISRHKNGTYFRTYASLQTAYTTFVLILMCFLWYSTLTELMNRFQENKVPGSYMLFITLFSFPLPFIFIVESRKMPEFFNKWRKFEADFRASTGSVLDFTGMYLLVIGYAIKVLLSVLFFVLQRYQFPVVTNRGIIFVLYEYWVVATLTSFWNNFLFFLLRAGDALHDLAKKLVRNKSYRVTFEDVEVLWYDLYRLLKLTGRTFCFTYCYFILFMFLMLMVTAYESLIIIRSPGLFEKIIFICLTIVATLHTASLPFASQMAAKKIGEDFHKLLLDLKTKEKSRHVRPEQMDGLLQAISDNQLTIDLGGFVTLDNGLITSLMSTMVTYLIVLVQFKV